MQRRNNDKYNLEAVTTLDLNAQYCRINALDMSGNYMYYVRLCQ